MRTVAFRKVASDDKWLSFSSNSIGSTPTEISEKKIPVLVFIYAQLYICTMNLVKKNYLMFP